MPQTISKITTACPAMAELGIAEGDTKAAVKKLLELYGNTWVFIEDDNYKDLLDAIIPDNSQPNEEETYDTPTKQHCTRQRKDQLVANTKYSESSLKRAPPRTMHSKFEEESLDLRPEPLDKDMHINPQELPVSGNNVNLVPCDFSELEISSNLICEGNLTNFTGNKPEVIVSKDQNPSRKVVAGDNYHSSLGVAHSCAFDDIARGEERSMISLEKETNAELPSFSYIAQN